MLHWFVQMALGVHYMHQHNIIHRDIKSQNMFIIGNNRVVLGDLGICKVMEHSNAFAKTCIGK